MKCCTILIASLLLIDPSALVSGKKYSSKPRPTGGSAPRPTSPTGSTPTANKPNSQPSSNNFRPTSTVKSPSNPSPTYKPVTQTGMPTTPSGGGGYNYEGARSPTFGGGGSLVAAGLGGFIAGSFLYGGQYRSPSCGGGYGYGYHNGCRYGRVSRRHRCKAQIPLCPIPESISYHWHTGLTTTVEVVLEETSCSIVNDYSPQPIVVGNITTPAANLTTEECMNRVVKSGTCEATKLFVFDNVNNICGCCSPSPGFLTTEFYSSTIYKYKTNSGLGKFDPPVFCVSGSTMFWPKREIGVLNITHETLSGGGAFTTESYNCSCGACDRCGSPQVKYLDWTGPFTVPEEAAQSIATSEDTAYDPVDTCVCDAGGAICTIISAGKIFSSSIFISSFALILSFVMLV